MFGVLSIIGLENIEDAVLARGNGRQLIYENDADREHFLVLVRRVSGAFLMWPCMVLS
jgi:hypothetical protein